ncbi:hypothetical protein OG871_09775 [Kitasatospora sp. NBC_00374]|uniref:hypothetical protein n=1 Tax=Kitasatospora sp. NBC_00374 TaxID=2975964 RepID=UPI00324A5BD7
MIVSISAVVFFGVLLVFLLRARRSTVSTALIATVFGFLLASSGVAPAVDSMLRSVAQAAHTLR